MDFNISILDYCNKIALDRTNLKKNFSSNKTYNNDYQLIGILGEMVYSYYSKEMLDIRLSLKGDSGKDFKNVQVKTSLENKCTHLIEHKEKINDGDFEYYVLVLLNLEKAYGYIYGMIPRKYFLKFKEIKNFGYGDKYCLNINRLIKFTQCNTKGLISIMQKKRLDLTTV